MMMGVLRAGDERYRVKHELKDHAEFNGGLMCSKIHGGTYLVPFVIYRLKAKDNNNYSMVNEGFENPCMLYVDDGNCFIQLKIKEMTQESMLNGF